MLETPAGQLPFPPSRRLFRAFNGRRVPSPTRRLLEGWESRPRIPVPATTPRLHAARRAVPKNPKKKGTLPDALAPLPTELLPIAVMVCWCLPLVAVAALFHLVVVLHTRKVDAPHADHHEERTHNKLDCRPDRRIHARKHERVRHNPAADKDCTIGLKLPDVLHLEVPSAMGRLGCRPSCCL